MTFVVARRFESVWCPGCRPVIGDLIGRALRDTGAARRGRRTARCSQAPVWGSAYGTGVGRAAVTTKSLTAVDGLDRRVLSLQHMAIRRMDHVGVVVDDLAAATEFFVELGLELRSEGPVEGRWVDRVVALEGVRALSSSASWSATRTATGSATSEARRESSSSWRSRSADESGVTHRPLNPAGDPFAVSGKEPQLGVRVACAT
jgi:catechol 2,3-dioxygenase-like lactoylglutathione lyase family enzyme